MARCRGPPSQQHQWCTTWWPPARLAGWPGGGQRWRRLPRRPRPLPALPRAASPGRRQGGQLTSLHPPRPARPRTPGWCREMACLGRLLGEAVARAATAPPSEPATTTAVHPPGRLDRPARSAGRPARWRGRRRPVCEVGAASSGVCARVPLPPFLPTLTLTAAASTKASCPSTAARVSSPPSAASRAANSLRAASTPFSDSPTNPVRAPLANRARRAPSSPPPTDAAAAAAAAPGSWAVRGGGGGGGGGAARRTSPRSRRDPVNTFCRRREASVPAWTKRRAVLEGVCVCVCVCVVRSRRVGVVKKTCLFLPSLSPLWRPRCIRLRGLAPTLCHAKRGGASPARRARAGVGTHVDAMGRDPTASFRHNRCAPGVCVWITTA